MSEIEKYMATSISHDFLKKNTQLNYNLLLFYQSNLTTYYNTKFQGQQVYLCKRNNTNPKFLQSIEIFSNQTKFGFVPNNLSRILCSHMDSFPSRILLCYCVNATMGIFLLFQPESNLMDTMPDAAIQYI